MSDQHDASKVLEQLLKEHGLAGDTRLYREASRGALTETDMPGVYRLAANPDPSDAVIDVYGQGYLVQAEQVGPGLAFAESASPNWQVTVEMRALQAGGAARGVPSTDTVEVEVQLADVLRQGGLVYPVESVTVERAWYCTLPTGTIDVRTV